ncbi:hypothetical protein EYF80_049904 [Liparis tanakae]|uniref:Uncharacterized protein n=1 Tax=Liparis tanakae TaxID=230148 RepID=A0A4Z2FG99_9TELE|nr:hypothetical protein EYF80_049904 [Liparis tanakae]
MSLDSNDDEDEDERGAAGEPPSGSAPPPAKGKPPPLPPDADEFRPPLPERQATPERAPTLSDYSALKTAISQFKATNQMGAGPPDGGGGLSPGGFPVNPHQSFLCPSWSSYAGASGYAASPAYPASPCGAAQEQEYRPHGPPPAAAAPPTAIPPPPGPLANMASLPMAVKPPPPPHLMMLGHTYGSDAAGAAGNSPLATSATSLPYTDHNDSAPPAYGPPGQHNRTLARPGDGVWGGGACRTAGGHGGVPPGGPPNAGETLGGGGAPGGPGSRTQENCVNNAVIPTAATRGSPALRPKMPPHPMCGVGYGGMGGPMDYGPMRGGGAGLGFPGGFRGRGAPPPVGLWPRPERGHDRGGGAGGGPCGSWGYPTGRGGAQGRYSDYTYAHSYAPE